MNRFTFGPLLLVSLLLISACNERSETSQRALYTQEQIGPELGFPSKAQTEDAALAEQAACEAKIQETLEQPALPGAPDFEKRRVDVLFNAKAEPVLFVRTPGYNDTEEVKPLIKGHRQLLAATSYHWDTVKTLVEHFKKIPRDGRQTLLRDGYFYADHAELAFSLVHLVSAQHLFGHDRIWLQRGERTFYAERKNGKYFFSDGPNKGEQVKLMLFDRVGAGEPDAKPLHRDLRSLQYRLHFERMQVQHVLENSIVAKLLYGEWWVPTLLKTSGARVDLDCEALAPGIAREVRSARSISARRQKVTQQLRGAVMAEIAEGLPFDEPRHEYGLQLDGVLRKNWRWAYFSGRAAFNYNGDRYSTFDRLGRPHVPQVCVDFITDTFERSAGTWYRPKGEPPGKTTGGFDFGTELEKPYLRKAPDFVQYVKEHTEWFDVFDPPPRQRIEIGNRTELIEYLTQASASYQPGDIVMIRGYTPWDPKKMHYHSFMLFERDPITGFPLALVGNAGRPSVRTWQIESRRTPKRMIFHRLRPRLEWLEQIQQGRLGEVSEEPVPLSPPGTVE